MFRSYGELRRSVMHTSDGPGERQRLVDAIFRVYIRPYTLTELMEYGDNRYTHWGIKGPESRDWLVVIGGETREGEARSMAVALKNARSYARQQLHSAMEEALGDDDEDFEAAVQRQLEADDDRRRQREEGMKRTTAVVQRYSEQVAFKLSDRQEPSE